MKKNGFTLVELLSVLIILGLLIVLTIPSFANVYTGVRRENLNGKITEIKAAALKYGDTIKDEVKNASGSCLETNVAELIEKGYLISESDSENVIYSSVDNTPLDEQILICYNIPKFDIEVYYVYNFKSNKYYYKNDMVKYHNPSNNKDEIYKCVIDYPANGGIYATNDNSKRYFVQEK